MLSIADMIAVTGRIETVMTESVMTGNHVVKIIAGMRGSNPVMIIVEMAIDQMEGVGNNCCDIFMIESAFQ